MADYHKVTKDDCLSVATAKEKTEMLILRPVAKMKELAQRWCQRNGYDLGGYLGNESWDAWLVKPSGPGQAP